MCVCVCVRDQRAEEAGQSVDVVRRTEEGLEESERGRRRGEGRERGRGGRKGG